MFCQAAEGQDRLVVGVHFLAALTETGLIVGTAGTKMVCAAHQPEELGRVLRQGTQGGGHVGGKFRAVALAHEELEAQAMVGTHGKWDATQQTSLPSAGACPGL